MTSSNFNLMPPADAYEADGRWDGSGGEVLVEVKRTHNVRDIRGALLALAYLLAEAPRSTRALCVLVQSRLSASRIEDEAARFRALVRPDVAQRIHLVSFDAASDPGAALPHVAEPGFGPWLADLVARQTTRPRASRQTVTSALALLHLRGAGPQTLKALQELCGASYPTAASAIAEFSGQDLLEPRSDRRVQLRYLPAERWLQIAQKHAAGRKVHRFIEPTGQARPPKAMAARLFQMQQQGLAANVAVGGVQGALHYDPDLDITASPRLDLSVYGPGNLDFVRHLDAALELSTDARAKPVLVLHLTSEPLDFINRQGGTWASEMECCADLLEIGLAREAGEMIGRLGHPQPAPGKGAPA